MTRVKQDDLYVILQWVYKYRDCKPKLALEKLQEIDVVRNNYSKNSLYNVFHSVKTYFKTGKIRKVLTETHIEILEQLRKEYEDGKPVYTEPVKSKVQEVIKLTPEQELQKLKDQYNKLMDLRVNKEHEYRKKQEQLKKEFDLFMDTSDDMLDEMQNQIKFLQREVLRGQILKELK